MAATFADYLGMALLTPALPYFLSDVVGLDARGVATWTGAITTAQYAGGAMGNMIVGTMGDKLGSRATLGVTLAGDVLFFTLTAVNRHRGALLALRFLAGLSSPLVAALHHILKQARDKMHVLEGVNAYSLSVNAGYALGGIIVGVGYDDAGVGWAQPSQRRCRRRRHGRCARLGSPRHTDERKRGRGEAHTLGE